MTPEYIEVQLRTSANSSELAGLLHHTELTGAWDEDGLIHLYWQREQWTNHMIEQIQKALQSLTDGSTGRIVSVNSVPWEDWNARWAAAVKPIGIGQRIVIRPSWETVAVPPNGIELIIDPKQAFGTGHHATTQLLIEWLEDLIQGGETVLDVGTGSGILAMIALRLGTASALGIDYDPIAIDCARNYASLDGFQHELDLCTASLEELGLDKFKVMLSNLDAQTILKNRRKFSQYCATNGTLLLSVILGEDREDILQAFSSEGWDLLDVREREMWLAIGMRWPNEKFTPAGSQGIQ